MATLAAIIDEVTALVRSTLSLDAPATPGHVNVLTSIQAAKRSFVEQVKDGTVELPCVVIDIGDLVEDKDFGVANDWARLPILFHYIREWGPTGNQRVVAAEVRTLRDALNAPGAAFTTFTPYEKGTIRTGTDSPVNASLFVGAKSDIIASCLFYTPGFLVQMDDA